MQSPGRKRPLPRKVALDPPAADLARCAAMATYVGSPEHKSFPSFAGAPRLRSDASRCPTELKDPDVLTGWLREGILAGNVSDVPVGEGFPRYVWTYRNETWFEARVTNPEQGTYKGYPLNRDQAPRGAKP